MSHAVSHTVYFELNHYLFFTCPKVKVEGGKVYVTADKKVSHVHYDFHQD